MCSPTNSLADMSLLPIVDRGASPRRPAWTPARAADRLLFLGDIPTVLEKHALRGYLPAINVLGGEQ